MRLYLKEPRGEFTQPNRRHFRRETCQNLGHHVGEAEGINFGDPEITFGESILPTRGDYRNVAAVRRVFRSDG
jgi:hypothetical protein